MKLLIAGLSSQSATAVELIAGHIWSTVEFVRLQRNTSSSLLQPTAQSRQCDICVVDLMGMGIARWSVERQQELQGFLAQRRAAILLPAGTGGGWLDGLGPVTVAERLVLLQHPVSAEAVREALGQVRLLPGGPGEAVLDESPMPVARSGRYGAPVAPQSPLAKTGSHALVAGQRLSDGGYAALLKACPGVDANPFLNLFITLMVDRQPLTALQITAQSGAIICPDENWIVSNISTVLRNRLIDFPEMTRIISVSQLNKNDAVDKAKRLYGRRTDGRRPLDTFMWALAYATYAKSPPVAVGDLCFSLNHFPNFSRLQKMPEIFVQLALISLHQPQTLRGLQKVFSRHDPGLITLFVVCAVLSESATVLDVDADTVEPLQAAIPKVAAVQSTRMRGFFKSLLDKLF